MIAEIRDGLTHTTTATTIRYVRRRILRLEQKGSDYVARFDANYAKGEPIPALPPVISEPEHCEKWISALPALKELMNCFFSVHAKSEREFQQLVAWENNRSPVAGTNASSRADCAILPDRA